MAIWGLRTAQQFLLLPPAKPRDLETLARREARRDIGMLQIQSNEASCGVALGSTRQTATAGARREVLFVAASTADVRSFLQPLVEAGFVIDGVVTPALALTSIDRLRRGATPGGARVYVALNSGATGVAIVRDGLLLFTREIPWGYNTDAAADPRVGFDRGAFAARIASELRRSFLFFKQTFKVDIERVVICGELPNVRSMTAPLMTGLEIEIETLDSMAGIDVASLPRPVNDFEEQVAALRLAWAIAADPAPPINLLPPEIVAQREKRRMQLTFGGGFAAAALVGVLLFSQANATARAREAELRRVQQSLAVAEPQALALSESRERQVAQDARAAALDAFDSQGPRLARVLEAISRAVPTEIVLNAIKMQPTGASWRATMSGVAVTSDPALAQASVNKFLRDLQTSPYLGAPVRSPALRMTTGHTREDSDVRAAAPSVPAGMSGIEFSVEFDIRK